MKPNECDAIQELLIDYADGEASNADGVRLERHLDHCGHCRAELKALRRSLFVAQSLWKDSASLVHGIKIPSCQRRRRSVLLTLSISAAAALALLTIGLPQNSPRRDRAVVHSEDADQGQSVLELEDIDIDMLIQRNEGTARLATAIRFLAAVPEMSQDKERAEQYLRDMYRD